MRNEFDQYAENYDKLVNNALSDVIDVDSDYFSEYKVKEVFHFCQQYNLHPGKILNFGCGTGKSEKFFIKYFPTSKIYGYDVSQNSIDIAKNQQLPKTYFFTLKNGSYLKNDFFDIIFISNVFHHIDHTQHQDILQDLYKKMKRNTYLVIFEHNTLNPLTLKVVQECELDKNAHLLPFWYTKKILNTTNFQNITSHFILFVPPFLKKLLFLERWLRWLPFGAQYYYIAKK